MDGGTAYLVATLGCLVAVAGVVVAVLALRAKRRQARKSGQTKERDPFRVVDDDADAVRGDPRRLRPGDIVEIRNTQYGVRGTLRFAEGDWGWAEHLLDDAQGAKIWLSVEEDPDLELVFWTGVPGPDGVPQPGPARLDFAGRSYTSDEAGQARYTATGTTGLNPSGTVRYHDYLDPTGARLSFESYGDSPTWEASTGELLQRSEVRIYPQSTSGTDGGPIGRAG
ncbi:DUF4178 domain-containing protein [Micromonospora sp. NBC_01699]|uniref:DUF4178 domain-containing protein n=1 Tax=Micromonospora sp. NBC_01699 TaxID=2975984 RepID=UPI002E2AD13F|nr:DUF4178 domain-containing protein [Micromonospora sp. NBC_01699]